MRDEDNETNDRLNVNATMCLACCEPYFVLSKKNIFPKK